MKGPIVKKKTVRAEESLRCRRRAFTLVELIVASGISIFVLTTLMVSFVAISNSFDTIGKYSDLAKQSRKALDLMSQDIRQAASLTNWTASTLAFTNVDGSLLTYSYQTNTGLLRYTNVSAGRSGVLLSNCTSLAFSLFQRTPTNGPMSFYTASNASSAKGVQMSFTCANTNYQGTKTIETGETTTIIMRN